LRSDESVSGLLQLGVGIEVLQVCKGVQSNISLEIGSGQLVCFNNPRMSQSLGGSRSFVLIKSQKLSNEIFSSSGDRSPDWIGKREFSRFNLLHDFLVGGSIERWDT